MFLFVTLLTGVMLLTLPPQHSALPKLDIYLTLHSQEYLAKWQGNFKYAI